MEVAVLCGMDLRESSFSGLTQKNELSQSSAGPLVPILMLLLLRELTIS